jgi:prevent-host-death family protein
MRPTSGPAWVPLAEAKNTLSALISRVEQGEAITITRRGVPVVRLVPDQQRSEATAIRNQQIATALATLQTLRAGLVLEGDLREIARGGLA